MLKAVSFGQYRTKSVWRLCTPSACKFPVIFHKNAREYSKYSLRFLFHLTKNLTTHLSHNLCAVLPLNTRKTVWAASALTYDALLLLLRVVRTAGGDDLSPEIGFSLSDDRPCQLVDVSCL